MKKYIILLAVAACGMLSSCGVYTEAPRSTFKAFLDFRPYAAEGFYITSAQYIGESVSLGELMIDVTPEFKQIRYEQREKYDAVVYDLSYIFGYEFIETEELMRMAVDAAKEVGANALSEFRINKEYVGGKPLYSVRGTCLKIEK